MNYPVLVLPSAGTTISGTGIFFPQKIDTCLTGCERKIKPSSWRSYLQIHIPIDPLSSPSPNISILHIEQSLIRFCLYFNTFLMINWIFLGEISGFPVADHELPPYHLSDIGSSHHVVIQPLSGNYLFFKDTVLGSYELDKPITHTLLITVLYTEGGGRYSDLVWMRMCHRKIETHIHF